MGVSVRLVLKIHKLDSAVLEWEHLIIPILLFKFSVLAFIQVLIVYLMAVQPCEDAVFHLEVPHAYFLVQIGQQHALLQVFQVIALVNQKVGIVQLELWSLNHQVHVLKPLVQIVVFVQEYWRITLISCTQTN